MTELGFKYLNCHTYGFIFWQPLYSPLYIWAFLTWNLWFWEKFSNLVKLDSRMLTYNVCCKGRGKDGKTVGSSYYLFSEISKLHISNSLENTTDLNKCTDLSIMRIIIKKFPGDKNRKGKAVNMSQIFESDSLKKVGVL